MLVSWDTVSGLTYWLFSAQTTTLTRDNILKQPSPRILDGITSPYSQTGLTNGLPYSFLMNAAVGSDKAGATTAAQTVTPMASGYTWTAGPVMDAGTRRGISGGAGVYVAVGLAAASIPAPRRRKRGQRALPTPPMTCAA